MSRRYPPLSWGERIAWTWVVIVVLNGTWRCAIARPDYDPDAEYVESSN